MATNENPPAAKTIATIPTTSTTIQATFTVEFFDATKTKWSRWVKRLEVAYNVFKVCDELKLPYLLHYMGSESYDIVCDKLAPDSPEEKAYDEIVQLLDTHYNPAPLEIAEVFRFQSRKQQDGERVQDFLHALQKLAINCKFGTFQSTALRNQLVYGLYSKRIQSRLLEVKDLTLDRALEIAVGMELSEQDSHQLQNKMAVNAVHTLRNKKRNPHGKKKNAIDGRKNTTTKNSSNTACYRCGNPAHLANKCPFINSTCKFCNLPGHLQKVCSKFKNSDAHQIEVQEDILQIDLREKFLIDVNINNKIINFEIDSGAAVSLMSESEFRIMFQNFRICKSDINLLSYCKTPLKVSGQVYVNVNVNDVTKQLSLYLIDSTNRKPLLGREWIRELGISLHNNDGSILQINPTPNLNSILDRYGSIFKHSIGEIKGLQANLKLKPGTSPVFIKARTVPFALIPKVDAEIDNLVRQNILTKVDHSEWATPIVPVLKSNGSIRLCGDFKITLNPNLVTDEHPLPTINELFASMAGGEKFTKLDLSQAFLHLPLNDACRGITTLNTHRGLFKCNRLMYGISSAPAIWQREIENILKEIPGVTVFIDDIKITGKDDSEHLTRLDQVLNQLLQHNIHVNLDKCSFLSKQIDYCGYVIDKMGIHKMQSKVEAVQNAKTPTNKTELRSLIGLINYYGRFFRNLSTILYPLNKLLHKATKFEWNAECEESFNNIRSEIQSDNVLAHYDPTLPLQLSTDASPYGVGAVLSHVYSDGSERPIQFVSHTLSATQQKYSQLDKEAYAIIFGIKRFYQYLYGRKFDLITDCQPLIQILNPKKELPTFTATRMQHYAIFLQAFDFNIKYRNTSKHANADAMSRLCIAKEGPNYDQCDVFEILQIEKLPVTFQMLDEATLQDESLKKLHDGLTHGFEVNKMTDLV